MTQQNVRRRWLQFSVRSTLLLVFLLSLPFAWLASKRHDRHREQRAVIAIEKLGGHASYNWNQTQSDAPPGPQWLRSLFGDELFTHVTSVGLHKPHVTDSDLSVLDSLPHVEDLSLQRTSISDAGLSHLRRMRGLTDLTLSETRVTDASVAVLKRLSRLERLDLQDTLVTACGIAELQAALPNCKVVRYLRPGDGEYSTFAPIHDAAKAGDIEMMRAEVTAGVPIDVRVSTIDNGGTWDDKWDDTTPLMWAASRGQTAAVRFLIDAGADVNAKSFDGVTPLMAAAGEYWNHGTVLIVAAQSKRDAANKVRHLLAAGANLEAKDDEGRTALLAASEVGHMEAVVLLAEAGADVNVAGGEDVMTPLLCVANHGADLCFMCEQTGSRAARALILRGAELRARDKSGNSPRMLAEMIHHDEVLAVLDEFGG